MEEKDLYIELNETTTKKVNRLDERRQKRAAEGKEKAEGPCNSDQNVAAERFPEDLKPRAKRPDTGLADDVLKAGGPDDHLEAIRARQAERRAKNPFWAGKDIADAYCELLPKRDFS